MRQRLLSSLLACACAVLCGTGIASAQQELDVSKIYVGTATITSTGTTVVLGTHMSVAGLATVGTLRATYGPVYDITAWGAVSAETSVDGTYAATNDAAFAAILADIRGQAHADAVRAVIFIPRGFFHFSTTLNIAGVGGVDTTTAIRLQGVGMGLSHLFYTGHGAGIVFASPAGKYNAVSDLSLYHDDGTLPGAITQGNVGIKNLPRANYADVNGQVSIERVGIYGFADAGIQISGGTGPVAIRDVEIQNCRGYGIQLVGHYGAFPQDVSITGGNIQESLGGIAAHGGGGLSITDVDIELGAAGLWPAIHFQNFASAGTYPHSDVTNDPTNSVFGASVTNVTASTSATSGAYDALVYLGDGTRGNVITGGIFDAKGVTGGIIVNGTGAIGNVVVGGAWYNSAVNPGTHYFATVEGGATETTFVGVKRGTIAGNAWGAGYEMVYEAAGAASKTTKLLDGSATIEGTAAVTSMLTTGSNIPGNDTAGLGGVLRIANSDYATKYWQFRSSTGLDLALDYYNGSAWARNLGIGTNGNTTITGTLGAGAITTSGATGGFLLSPRDASGDTFQWFNPTGDAIELHGTTHGSIFSINADGEVASGTWHSTAISADHGGTGLTSYTAGDLLYASAGTTIGKLTVGTAYQVLHSNGTIPAWTSTLGATGTRLTAGWFTDLTVTNAIGGSITGNAATATKLATARAINGVDFDGSAAITVTAAAGTLTGNTLASGVTASSLTSVGTITTGVWNAGAITSSGAISSVLATGGVAKFSYSGYYSQFGVNSSYVPYWAHNATWHADHWDYVSTGGFGGYASILTATPNEGMVYSTTSAGTDPITFTTKFSVTPAGAATFASTISAGAITSSGMVQGKVIRGTNNGDNAYAVLLVNADQSYNRVQFQNTGAGGKTWDLVGGTPGVDNAGFAIYNATDAVTALKFTATGNATIGGTLTVNTTGSIFQGSAAGTTDLIVKSLKTDGTGEGASLALYTSNSVQVGSVVGFDQHYGSVAGTPYTANALAVRGLQAGGLNLVGEHASGDIRFYTGGTTLAATIDHHQATSFVGSLSVGTTLGVTGVSTFSASNIALDYDTAAPGPTLNLDSSLSDKSDYMGSVVFKLAGTAVSSIQNKEHADDTYGIWFRTFSSTLNVSAAIYGNGDFYTNDGSVHSLSDERTKTKVKPFNAGLDAIKAMQSTLGVYRYRADLGDTTAPRSQREFIGVTAQSVQPWIPEAVDVGDDGFLTMTSTPIIYALMNTTVTLDTRIAALEAELAKLKEKRQ